MIQQSKAIVLKLTPYTDSSAVVQLYTEEYGLQAYIINGVKKPKAKITQAMLQPLNLLHIVAYHKPSASLQRLKELQVMPHYLRIPYNHARRSIVLFLNELLYKSLKQQSADPQLFNFIFNALATFDAAETTNHNFHLSFILQLSYHYGFGLPAHLFKRWLTSAQALFYNIATGDLEAHPPSHPSYFSQDEGQLLHSLLNTPLHLSGNIHITNTTRRIMLNKLIQYFSVHVPNITTLQAHTILEEIYTD